MKNKSNMPNTVESGPSLEKQLAMLRQQGVTLRPERLEDYRAVEALTRDAFWDVYKPGAVEHLVVHRLRQSAAYLPGLSFVAQLNGQVAGSIVYSKAAVCMPGGAPQQVLTFGPISVLPALQGRGIGAALILHTQRLAAGLGYKGIVIFGSPAYYHRFGFKNAEEFGIKTKEGGSFDAFMALELAPGALKEVQGRFYEDEAFEVGEGALAEFEKQFPYREKHVTDTQIM